MLLFLLSFREDYKKWEGTGEVNIGKQDVNIKVWDTRYKHLSFWSLDKVIKWWRIRNNDK